MSAQPVKQVAACGGMIEITEAQHAALLGMTYTRPALRALLGEALTEAEYFEIKRSYRGFAPRIRLGRARAEAAVAAPEACRVADLTFISRNESRIAVIVHARARFRHCER